MTTINIIILIAGILISVASGKNIVCEINKPEFEIQTENNQPKQETKENVQEKE